MTAEPTRVASGDVVPGTTDVLIKALRALEMPGTPTQRVGPLMVGAPGRLAA